MRTGKQVTYYDASGVASTASCVSISDDVSVSGCKILTLSVNGQPVKDVPHKLDAEKGAYWTLVGDSPREAVPAAVAPIAEPPLSVELPEAVSLRARTARKQEKDAVSE